MKVLKYSMNSTIYLCTITIRWMLVIRSLNHIVLKQQLGGIGIKIIIIMAV